MQQLFEPVRELWLEIKLITECQISIIITQTIIIPITLHAHGTCMQHTCVYMHIIDLPPEKLLEVVG